MADQSNTTKQMHENASPGESDPTKPSVTNPLSTTIQISSTLTNPTSTNSQGTALTDNTDLSVEQAINRVLLAEREAEQIVRDCYLKSQQNLEQSRRQANVIAARAGARISWVHQRCRRAVTDAKTQIKHQRGELQDPALSVDEQVLTRVTQVIAELLSTPGKTGWKS
ncbi:MAG: hypothetical protein OEZ68_07825 [Gammaproteobacteria bacterium]|nr:hypothetical protein [Gammaproteobacteria bacterium]MDH5800694.1 hypothetical protein [Gammaproteobacteria bacterium]